MILEEDTGLLSGASLEIERKKRKERKKEGRKKCRGEGQLCALRTPTPALL